MLTRHNEADLKSYLEEARSWESSATLAAERSRRVAWIVATVACGVASASVIAVAGLTPLKQTELRIIKVDSSTGIVDVVTEMPDARTTYDEAINKFFVQLYIRYREGYSREIAEEQYNNVALMSDSAEQRRYFDWFNPKNAASPLNVYGETARVRTRVKSVSFIKKDVALVRYIREVERSSSEKPAVTHWAATIAFKYAGAPMSEKDRAVNPLGFQVSEYRNDPDSSLPEAPPTPAPALPAVTSGSVVLFPGSGPTQQPNASSPAPIRLVQ